MEKLEDMKLTFFSSGLLEFLELKARWIELRKRQARALCELFLLERDPSFDLEEKHSWEELRARCARIWAKIPGCTRWYQCYQ